MYATACARPKRKDNNRVKKLRGKRVRAFSLAGFFSASRLTSHWLPYVSPSTRGPRKMVPTSALTSPFACPGETRCRLISPREAPAATRASARAGAGFAACAGHAERGGHRPRPTRGSFRGFRRSIKRASRSVRPASTPAFPSARVKRQFPPVALRSRVSEGRARRVASSGTRRAASASSPWLRSPAYPTSRTASFGSHRPGAARTRHPRRRRLLSRSASFSAGLRGTEEGRPGARAAREPADRRR